MGQVRRPWGFGQRQYRIAHRRSMKEYPAGSGPPAPASIGRRTGRLMTHRPRNSCQRHRRERMYTAASSPAVAMTCPSVMESIIHPQAQRPGAGAGGLLTTLELKRRGV